MTVGDGRVLLRALPELGFAVPGSAVRVIFAAVAVALSVTLVPPGFWLVVAIASVVLAVVRPRSLAAWVLMIGLGIDQATGPAATVGVEFAVLVAGVHLLHVLAAQMCVIPSRAVVQASVLGRPLLRFVVVQIPVQAVALVVLGAFSTDVAIPAIGVVGAIAVIVLAVLLAVPLLRERARN